MDAAAFRDELQTLASREGLRGLSRRLGLDPGYLSRVCTGERLPGPALLRALGYERIEAYVKKDSKPRRS